MHRLNPWLQGLMVFTKLKTLCHPTATWTMWTSVAKVDNFAEDEAEVGKT